MRPWIVFAAFSGAGGVALGAYAAHGLAGDPYAAGLAERAVQFLLVHALALLAADGRRAAHAAAGLFVLGILLFCGSLTWKALGGTLPVPMITPAGGMALIAGWLALALAGALPRRT